MKLIKYAVLLLLVLSCNSDKKIKYSFFVAGHTYGNHKAKNLGLHPPFKNKFDLIKNNKNVKFGVLTGDVVRSGSRKKWDTVSKELNTLNIPIHFSRGNHDGGLEFFEKLHDKSYKSFLYKNDLHIILDSSIDRFNISGLQLAFLKHTLENNLSVNSIFIYVHDKIWYNKEYNMPPNISVSKGKFTFWEQVYPLLKNNNKPIFLFAGDVGAFYRKNRPQYEAYSYATKANITFITSGMGGGKYDNFIVCDVLNDNSIKFRLIHLNGSDINSLGELKNYKRLSNH